MLAISRSYQSLIYSQVRKYDGEKYRNVAVARAAQIVLTEVNKVATNPRASSKELTRALIPLFGIRWNKETFQRVAAVSSRNYYIGCETRNLTHPHIRGLATSSILRAL